MDFKCSGGCLALAIALLSIVRVSGKCLPYEPCAKSTQTAGSAPVPGCTCKTPNPMLTPYDPNAHKDDRATRWKGFIGGPAGSNEVEILTLDVGLANRIRSANASVAAEIAYAMHVPVERVSVTPFSYTADQGKPAEPSSQIAFIQQDHERCDCESEDGTMVQGQGFKSASVGSAGANLKLAADTSIMTATQFNLLSQHAQDSAVASEAFKALESDDVSKTQKSIDYFKTPSRIQLLTRDPCLVEQLVSSTTEFAKRIAHFIGVPEKSVLVHPPAVKGVVGLLQVDSTTESEEATTLLAVKRCNKLPHTLSLVGQAAAPAAAAPAAATAATAAAAAATAAATAATAAATTAATAAATATALKKKAAAAAATAAALKKKESAAAAGAAGPKPADWPANLPWPPALKNAARPAAAPKQPAGWPITLPFPLPQRAVDAATRALTRQTVVMKPSLPMALSPTPMWTILPTPNAAFAASLYNASAPRARVLLPMKCKNVNYDQLMSNPLWTSSFTDLVKDGISVTGNLTGVPQLNSSDVELALYPESTEVSDSMDVEAKIQLPLGATGELVASLLEGNLSSALQERFNRTRMMLTPFTTVGTDINCTVTQNATLEFGESTTQPEENRAWISSWDITVLPPFGKIGAKRLLEMVGSPTSELSRLLPGTMAYVPGLVKDRSMGPENAAPETRLPPPMAVSNTFGLPTNKFELEDLKDEARRSKYEGDLAMRIIKTKRAHERRQAAAAVADGKLTKAMVVQASKNFLAAAHAHVTALRPHV